MASDIFCSFFGFFFFISLRFRGFQRGNKDKKCEKRRNGRVAGLLKRRKLLIFWWRCERMKRMIFDVFVVDFAECSAKAKL